MAHGPNQTATCFTVLYLYKRLGENQKKESTFRDT